MVEPFSNVEDEKSAEKNNKTDEAKKRDAERVHSRANDFFLKLNEATVNSGQLAVRTTVIINGGAAIAILAFIGGLIGQGRLSLTSINSIAGALMWFVSGVGASVFSMGGAYFANYCLGRRAASKRQTWDFPYLVSTPKSATWRRWAIAFQSLAIASAVAALALFVWGMLEVRIAIGRLA